MAIQKSDKLYINLYSQEGKVKIVVLTYNGSAGVKLQQFVVNNNIIQFDNILV